MLKKSGNKLEKAAYIAIICMTIFTISLVSYRYFVQTDILTSNKIKTGDYLDRSVIEIPKSERVIVLFITQNCKFCRESGSFYQKLIKSAEIDKSVSIMTVFPNNERYSEDYFKKDGILFPQKAYTDFESLGVIYTPTALLVNKDGRIIDSWVGKLSEESERKVLSHIYEN